jgi:Polyketide cyclase / dehydrase and lipid transport
MSESATAERYPGGMVEAHAEALLSVPASRAFEEATDLTRADWLPAVRRLRHVGGPVRGVGARYEAEVDVPGHRLHGVLVCQRFEPPRQAVYVLESGLDLTIAITVYPAGQGCRLELRVRYTVGGGLAGRALERATIAPARRETARAVTTLAARLQGGTAAEAAP